MQENTIDRIIRYKRERKIHTNYDNSKVHRNKKR